MPSTKKGNNKLSLNQTNTVLTFYLIFISFAILYATADGKLNTLIDSVFFGFVWTVIVVLAITYLPKSKPKSR
jgi:hypothetical protein